MRIEALNQMGQIYQSSGVKKTGKTNEVSKQDSYEISQSGKDYQIAKNALEESSDVRQDRVSQIKEELASGTYNVSAQEIADKIVNKYFDFSV